MGIQAYNVSKFIPFHDQKQEWECRLRMIHEAKQFLYISTYFVQYDNYGREFVNALLAARERGVYVTLLIDKFGHMLSSNLMTPHEKICMKREISNLIEKGVIVIFYRCRSLLQRVLGSGMHIKIQLSENGGALFNSGNISETSYDKWQEFSAYVEGSIVARLLEEFTALGVDVKNNHQRKLNKNQPETIITDTVRYLSYNPTYDVHPLNPIRLRHANDITDYLVDAFTKAESHILLTSFFFKPAPVLLSAIKKAAARGVSIEIFHSHPGALGPSMVPWIPCFYHYKSLVAEGLTIYENLKGEHSKIILIDGKKVIFGSYNLEYAAHDRLAEAMMISENAELLEFTEAIFKKLRGSSDNIKVTPETILTALRENRWKILFSRPFLKWL